MVTFLNIYKYLRQHLINYCYRILILKLNSLRYYWLENNIGFSVKNM